MKLLDLGVAIPNGLRSAAAECRRHVLVRLTFPLHNDIRMNPMLLRKVGQRQHASYRLLRHLGLELRRVPRPLSRLRIVLLVSRSTLTPGPNSWDHLSQKGAGQHAKGGRTVDDFLADRKREAEAEEGLVSDKATDQGTD